MATAIAKSRPKYAQKLFKKTIKKRGGQNDRHT
jgi:hypothetical protein